MMIDYDSYCDDDRGLFKSIVDRGYCENCDNRGGAVAKRHRFAGSGFTFFAPPLMIEN